MWFPILREKPSIIESFSKLSYTTSNFRGLYTTEEGSLCTSPCPSPSGTLLPGAQCKAQHSGEFVQAAVYTCASDRITLSSLAVPLVADEHCLILGTESRAWAGFWLSSSCRCPVTISHVVCTRASQHKRVSPGSPALVSMLGRPCELCLRGGALSALGPSSRGR